MRHVFLVLIPPTVLVVAVGALIILGEFVDMSIHTPEASMPHYEPIQIWEVADGVFVFSPAKTPPYGYADIASMAVMRHLDRWVDEMRKKNYEILSVSPSHPFGFRGTPQCLTVTVRKK